MRRSEKLTFSQLSTVGKGIFETRGQQKLKPFMVRYGDHSFYRVVPVSVSAGVGQVWADIRILGDVKKIPEHGQ